MTYLLRHWRGELSLAMSFWVNLVLVRAVLLAVDRLFQSPVIERIDTVLPLAVAYFAISLFVVYPWQVIGLLRATDRRLGQLGSSAVVFGAQAGIVVSLLPTGVSAFATFQPLLIDEPETPAWVLRERERASKYSVSVGEDGRTVSISGEFELGLRRRLEAVLDANPDVETVALDSDGGYVTQGRAVAKLIEARRLDTTVHGTCKSACAIAFVGGVTRRISRVGRLGFHQYRYAARTAHPNLDLQAEYRVDRDYFESRGIDREFAGRAFDAVHASIWYPDIGAMLAAGVVHEVIE